MSTVTVTFDVHEAEALLNAARSGLSEWADLAADGTPWVSEEEHDKASAAFHVLLSVLQSGPEE